MTRFTKRSILVTSLSLAGAALSACQSDKHTMVEPKDGTVNVCTECYNEVYKVQHASGSRGGGTVTQSHTRHVCPECKTEMSIYTQNGVAMVKCAKCAPEGLACDKCLPPKGWTPPKEAADSGSK